MSIARLFMCQVAQSTARVASLGTGTRSGFGVGAWRGQPSASGRHQMLGHVAALFCLRRLNLLWVSGVNYQPRRGAGARKPTVINPQTTHGR